MTNFRDAVAQVQEQAARGDLQALEVVLNHFEAERAARLAAANALGRAGKPGHQILLVTVMFSDTLGKFAALRSYLLHQERLDEELFLQAVHSKHTRVRRGMKRLLKQLPFPVSDELRLRCYLPEPYCYAKNIEESIPDWLSEKGAAWYDIVNAISLLEYEPAIPLLIDALKVKGYQGYALVTALTNFGATATPYLQRALPESDEPQRSSILRAMWRITYPDTPIPEKPSPALAELEAQLTDLMDDGVFKASPDGPVYVAPPRPKHPPSTLPPSSTLVNRPHPPAPAAKQSRFAALLERVKRFLSE